jgi:hypothetical protein
MGFVWRYLRPWRYFVSSKGKGVSPPKIQEKGYAVFYSTFGGRGTVGIKGGLCCGDIVVDIIRVFSL